MTHLLAQQIYSGFRVFVDDEHEEMWFHKLTDYFVSRVFFPLTFF